MKGDTRSLDSSSYQVAVTKCVIYADLKSLTKTINNFFPLTMGDKTAANITIPKA